MMKIYYENNSGVKLDLCKSSYRLQTGDLFDYEWDYVYRMCGSIGGKITGFKKGIKTKKLTLSIMSSNRASYEEALDFFYETVEKDLLEMKPGRLYVGEQYLSCFIVGSEKTEWECDCDLLDNEITLVTEYPFWIAEEFLSYQKHKEGEKSSNFLNHPYDFPYDYTSEQYGMSSITNDHYAPVHFEMVIYGPVIEPQIRINGYPYIVHTTVEENEYLTIDSRNKKVYRTLRNGEAVNEFNNRDFEHSIFEPIPPGKHPLNWGGNFGLDITMFKERSEPAWKPRRK